MKKIRALRAPNGGCNPFEKGPQGPKLTVLATSPESLIRAPALNLPRYCPEMVFIRCWVFRRDLPDIHHYRKWCMQLTGRRASELEVQLEVLLLPPSLPRNL